ncbi:hypothetical protein KL86SPO_31645 [uncultured Sporomusa sp.]|uniref:Uncharacterized protein n=1 Tax=uncultured Sporomusa sp. TaxID=307249 RepID=A0A212LVC2_9FIRM|nr:hypothetical protein KL86SPO_31645 [uncultured Sporomusa sp.]
MENQSGLNYEAYNVRTAGRERNEKTKNRREKIIALITKQFLIFRLCRSRCR